MWTLLVVTGLCLGMIGCCSSQKMVEGTTINLGAYIPWENSLYGVELISYVNGIKVNVASNSTMTVERTHSATNSWGWGLLISSEFSKTKVETK